jgi:hypothetical protein
MGTEGGSEVTRLLRGNGGRVLLLSMRRLATLVGYCVNYELEDVVAEVTGADRVDVGGSASLERSRRAYKLGRLATGSSRLGWALAPRPSTVRLERDYDLFLAVFNHPYELFALATVPEWRARSRVAVCFVNEAWRGQLPRYLLELLAPFDHVFAGVYDAVDEVGRIVGRPCAYLPLGTDVLRFAPWPRPPGRSIDVCNIGRRSPVTHEAMMRLARERRIFYYYDTVVASGADGRHRTFSVGDAAEHRGLLASLLQRSRYFIANRARVNEPEFAGGRDEISSRFYEGAAAGTVMLGEPPRDEEFRRQFDWADAVIPLPFHSPDAARIIEELDRDPGRLARIRRDGVRNAALRHDWVHRLRAIYEAAGLPPPEAMREREARLAALASEVERSAAGA